MPFSQAIGFWKSAAVVGIQFDNRTTFVTPTAISPPATHDFSHTVTNADYLEVQTCLEGDENVVSIEWDSGGAEAQFLTEDTAARGQFVTSRRSNLWYATGTFTGTKTISVLLSSGIDEEIIALALTLRGVNQTTPIITPNGSGNDDSNTQQSLTTASLVPVGTCYLTACSVHGDTGAVVDSWSGNIIAQADLDSVTGAGHSGHFADDASVTVTAAVTVTYNIANQNRAMTLSAHLIGPA